MKAGRASDIKGRGRGSCMEVSQTTVWSKGGLTKLSGSPAPKVVGKGVPEPMSQEGAALGHSGKAACEGTWLWCQ